MNSLKSSRSTYSSISGAAGKDHSAFRLLLTGCGLLRRKRRNRINPGGFVPPSTTVLDNAALTADSPTLEVACHEKPDEPALEAMYEKEPVGEEVAPVGRKDEEDEGEDDLEKWRAQLTARPLWLSMIKEEEEEESDGVFFSYEEEEEFYTPPSSPRWDEECEA